MILWAFGVGGPFMCLRNWAFVFQVHRVPSSRDRTRLHTLSFSRGDRTNRTRTLRKLRLKQASATQFLSSLIAVYSAILAGFPGLHIFLRLWRSRRRPSYRYVELCCCGARAGLLWAQNRAKG